MNSFDLFDTLIARRCVLPFTDKHDPQFARELQEVIPIAENLAQIRPDDVIVSDMYLTEDELWSLMQEAAFDLLGQDLYLSEDGKATGKVWQKVHPECHTGDNYTLDVEGPLAHGVPKTIHTTVARPTAVEQSYLDHPNAGVQALGRCIREARLGTFDEKYRELELCQIQANFPMLVLGSIALFRWACANEILTLLLSGRDCYLWSKLLPLFVGFFRVEYFHTSRVCRVTLTEGYREYLDKVLLPRKHVGVVDLCGTGWSLGVMSDAIGGVPLFLLSKYPGQLALDYQTIIPTTSNPDFLLEIASHELEAANYAPHRMVEDVVDGEPVYASSTYDWENSPEIAVAERAFMTCVKAFSNPYYDFTALYDLTDDELRDLAGDACKRLGDYSAALAFCVDEHRADERVIMDRLRDK